MIKNILFDLDGTLLDTSPGVFESLRLTFEDFGYKSLADEELHTFIGPPLPGSFMRVLSCTQEQADKMTEAFQKHYVLNINNANVYEGMFELLEKLKQKGYNLAVATYKPENQAISLLETKGVSKYMDVIHGSDELEKMKKSDIIELCISQLGNTKSETIMIGDSIYDSDAAQETGVDFVGVTYGFGFSSKKDLENISNIGIAKSPDEIMSILEKGIE